MVSNPVTEVRYTPNRVIGSLVPEGIVIHWWGDPNTNPQFNNIVNHLCTPNGAASVSAHFVVEENRVAQLANLNDVTWHAMSANTFTIGIECNPRKSDGDVLSVARLIAWIWEQLGGPVPIGTHNYYVATQCPGVWEDLAGEGLLWQMATKIYNGEDVEMSNPWDEVMTNRWGAKYAARDIFLSMDKNVVNSMSVTEKQSKTILTAVLSLEKKIDDLAAKVSVIDADKIADVVSDAVSVALKDLEIVLKTHKGSVNTEGEPLATKVDVNMLHDEIHNMFKSTGLR